MKEVQNPFNLAVLELYKSKSISEEVLSSTKRKIAKEFNISTPSNSDLLKAYHNLLGNKSIKQDRNIELILRKRKIRSLSGIVIVSVLTKPYSCPGKCLYCPTAKGMPKSYLPNEPAVMRAVLNKFDPYNQVRCRLEALQNNGHPIDKVDLRIIGGTWSYYKKDYQEWFIYQCFKACNDFNRRTPCVRKPTVLGGLSLKNIQKRNENAGCRITGITIETRPDYINDTEIKRLREFGVTRVELGVQNIYDDILKFNNRGHLIKATIEATRLLKDAGMKICYQMMPNLPGANITRDKKMFVEIFNNPDFCPDMIKIYPCAILKEAELYKLYKEGKYKPYSKKQLFDLIKFIKQNTPTYVRIQRIIRDIPAESIEAGPAKISNMRQMLLNDMKKSNWRCRCIRCREVGESYDKNEKLKLFRYDYKASGGMEIFLSFEDEKQEKLYSLLRLRLNNCGNSSCNSYCKNCSRNGLAMVRELHTYGQLHTISKDKNKTSPQHKGLGKQLMREAEKIAQNAGFSEISVISGVGVRDYYRKLGYSLKNTYMVKKLG